MKLIPELEVNSRVDCMTNNLKDTQAAVEEVLPKECELTKIEFEGPQIVLYLKNIKAFYADENLITRIAARLRKKILLRCDSSCLLPAEQALPAIKKIVPAEAGAADIRFDAPFNEVVIEAAKPGIAIGKGGVVLKQIMLETGWSPRILRAPTRPSEVVKAIRLGLLANSEDRKKFLVNLGKKIIAPSKSCDWIKLTALGGFKEVGRSCTLLQTPESNIIIDCGLNTDTSDASKAYPYLNTAGLALDDIDAVIVTHAHLDHSGFVPYLYAYGYDGPTYTTSATRDLMALLQRDCVKVMHAEAGEAPYAEKDIRTQLNHIITREYREVTDIAPDVRFTFYNSGHILGGSMVHLHIGEGLHNLVITSDFKYGRTNLLEQAETNFPRVETLVLESTYGSREDIQPRLVEGEARLTNIIRRTIEQRGKVLIPVFAVGRAQEVMLVLEKYFREENIPIYLDGMSLEASAIHTVYPEYLRKQIQRRILQNDSPFDKPVFVSMANKDRKEVVESEESCVILAPSGMLSGGPSVEFFRMLAPEPKNALVFVGYQAALSLGRRIQSGAREVPVLDEAHKLESVKVNMGVYTVDSFSGHSDHNQLLAFARNLRPRPNKILTMHGDNNKCDELARTLSRMVRCEARAPLNLDSIRLK